MKSLPALCICDTLPGAPGQAGGVIEADPEVRECRRPGGRSKSLRIARSVLLAPPPPPVHPRQGNSSLVEKLMNWKRS